MKRKYKKRTGVLLALAVITGLLTACGTESADAGLPEETEMAALPAAGVAAAREEEAGGAAHEESADGTEADPTGSDPAGEKQADMAAEAAAGWADGEEDPTLGGIFALYTPEEYEAVIDNIRKYADGDGHVVKMMEEDLEKLKADGGKGEFVIWKPAFEETYEQDGIWYTSSFNPTVVMDPQREYRQVPDKLTAENYEKEIETVTRTLDDALAKGMLTEAQKEAILAKMHDNLEKLR